MIDRRAKTPREAALDELATAIAESSIDVWLDGELGDGLDTHNNTGHNHETAASKANARKVKSTPSKKRAE